MQQEGSDEDEPIVIPMLATTSQQQQHQDTGPRKDPRGNVNVHDASLMVPPLFFHVVLFPTNCCRRLLTFVSKIAFDELCELCVNVNERLFMDYCVLCVQFFFSSHVGCAS
jgi:hypothetical protein